MTPAVIRILYMEDDAGLARLLKKRLERVGYAVTIACDGHEGLAMYDPAAFDVVAVDQNMPVYDGLEVIRRLAARGELPPIIMVTGTGNEQVAVEAMKIGARDYIVKDVEGGYLELLPAVIEQVLDQHRLAEEKRKADQALRQYAVELEARNEELDAFAHTVAHDLKDPLGLVIGYADVLRTSYAAMSDEAIQTSLRTISQSGRRMNNIINELLLLAGVRKMTVASAALDMVSIVAEAQRRLADLIERYRAEINLPGEWPTALGHGPWVEEVWVNYISNAIKYGGRPPRVDLGFSIDSLRSLQVLENGSEIQNPKSEMIRFWVRDNGPGIPPEQQTRLFTPFTRLDQVRAEGHGLGLSIVRRIVEKLGGQIGVKSQIGQGSVFYFTLPGAGD